MRALPRDRRALRLADWAEYGYRASHSRSFWGPRPHLVCTLHGLPVAFALTGAKADERETPLGRLDAEPHLMAARPGQTLISDRQYYGRAFERERAERGMRLLRPARKASPRGPDPPWSSRYGRSSSPSTRPSRPSSTSNATKAAHRPG